MKTATPELDKMLKVSEESNKIGNFLWWLRNEAGYSICFWSEYPGDWEAENDGREGEYFPVHKSIEQLLADYYKLDLDKMEQEKIALLRELRGEDI